MKNSLVLLSSLLMSVLVQAQNAPSPLLKVQNSGFGPPTAAYITVVVLEDGTVEKIQRGVTTTFTTLSAQTVGQIRSDIANIPQGPLVRIDPNQNYNPGGFTQEYILFDQSHQPFTFDKNVSGVDFGVNNSLALETLKSLLENLNRLADQVQ